MVSARLLLNALTMMLIRKFGALAGTCALGLIAACAGPSKGAGSSEAAATEEPKDGEIGSIEKICAVNGKADINFVAYTDGSMLSFVSSCAKDDAKGTVQMIDMGTGKGYLVDKANEGHNVRVSSDASILYYAAIERTKDRSTVHVHVKDFKNKREKDIPLFDAAIADADGLLEKRIASFDVKFSADNSTAIAYGTDFKADGTTEGRLVVAKLDAKDGEGITDLSVGVMGMTADADVTFAPDGKRALVLSMAGSTPRAEGANLRQNIYDIDLSAADPGLTAVPDWVIQKNHGEVVVVPGSFDGTSVLRWGADSELDGDAGYVSIAKVDGTSINLSKDLKVTSHSPSYATDADMHKPSNVAAFYASADANADVIFPGIAAPGKHDAEAPSTYIYAAKRDGSAVTPLAADAQKDGAGFVAATATGVMLYPSVDGVGAIDVATSKSSLLLKNEVTDKGELHASYISGLSDNGKFALISSFTSPAPATTNAAGTNNAGTNNNAGANTPPPDGENAGNENAAPDNAGTQNAAPDSKIDGTGHLQTLEIATGKLTELQLAATDKLRVSGALDGDWASTACGYDQASNLNMLDDGSVLALGKFRAATPECKRAAVASEILGWKPTGEGGSIALDKITTLADFAFIRTDTALSTQCDEAGVCTAYLTLPPGQSLIPAPKTEEKPSTKKPTPTDEGGDEGIDPDDGDDGVVVKKHGPTSSPSEGSEQTATGDTTKVVSTGGCSSAPGTSSSSLGGLGLLLGLTALTRRRRSAK